MRAQRAETNLFILKLRLIKEDAAPMYKMISGMTRGSGLSQDVNKNANASLPALAICVVVLAPQPSPDFCTG